MRNPSSFGYNFLFQQAGVSLPWDCFPWDLFSPSYWFQSVPCICCGVQIRPCILHLKGCFFCLLWRSNPGNQSTATAVASRLPSLNSARQGVELPEPGLVQKMKASRQPCNSCQCCHSEICDSQQPHHFCAAHLPRPSWSIAGSRKRRKYFVFLVKLPSYISVMLPKDVGNTLVFMKPDKHKGFDSIILKHSSTWPQLVTAGWYVCINV